MKLSEQSEGKFGTQVTKENEKKVFAPASKKPVKTPAARKAPRKSAKK